MHIGVDATCWQHHRGYGRHARALLTSLLRLDTANRYTFFVDSADAVAAAPPRAEVRLLQPSCPTTLAAAASGHRRLRDMWRMGRAMSQPGFDALLFPTIYSYVPTITRARKIVVIHDVIAESFPHLTLPRRAARIFWNAKVALGRMQADAIVTVSEYSRRCIVERFRMPERRVCVVGEASDPVFRALERPRLTPRLEAAGISANRRLVTYVGGFSPHKNLEILVEAFARLSGQDDFHDVLLVMVGEGRKDAFHSYFDVITAQVERLGIRDRVVFTGFLPDHELVVLLNLSTTLVLPSLMEGFGLPAVEAAACGCPVIATTASPLPGLLGNGGIYIEPRLADLECALATVLQSESLRRRMRDAGLAAAGRLTWDAAARQMMNVIREVAPLCPAR